MNKKGYHDCIFRLVSHLCLIYSALHRRDLLCWMWIYGLATGTTISSSSFVFSVDFLYMSAPLTVPQI